MGGKVTVSLEKLQQLKNEEKAWRDEHVKRILTTKWLVDGKNLDQNKTGIFFPDEKFSNALIDLLRSHPKIGSFEAEFGLYLHQSGNKKVNSV